MPGNAVARKAAPKPANRFVQVFPRPWLYQPLQEDTPVKRLDELFDDAREANVLLGKFIADVCRHHPGAIVHAKLKDKNTAAMKLKRNGKNDDPSVLNDICRATIYYDTIDQVFAAREYIVSRRAAEVALLYDRYSGDPQEQFENGYRDVKFILQMKLVKSDNPRHYCELQINVKTKSGLNDYDHPIYEIVRMGGGPGNWVPCTIHDGPDKQALAPKLVKCWVKFRQANILDTHQLARLRQVIRRFHSDENCTSIRGGSITVPAHEVEFLNGLMPHIYQAYQDKAVNAVLLKHGVQHQQHVMTASQAKAFVKYKKAP